MQTALDNMDDDALNKSKSRDRKSVGKKITIPTRIKEDKHCEKKQRKRIQQKTFYEEILEEEEGEADAAAEAIDEISEQSKVDNSAVTDDRVHSADSLVQGTGCESGDGDVGREDAGLLEQFTTKL